MATESIVSAGGFSGGPTESEARTAPNLQYQRFQQGLTATGAALGHGFRASPPYQSALFSNPPTPGRNLSGGQFGAGSAKDTMEEEED